MGSKQHKQEEDIKTKGDCCFNHIEDRRTETQRRQGLIVITIAGLFRD
jgi:hypothetical protein